MKNLFFTLLFGILAALTADAQNSTTLQRIEGEFIIRLYPGLQLNQFISDVETATGVKLTSGAPIAPDWRIYLLSFDEFNLPYSPERFLELIRRRPEVEAAQWNYKVDDRNKEPNDPEWLRQSNLVQIGATEAWVAGTGGVTPNGDTIVVAILEKGIYRDHPDLSGNLWYNYAEIPNDGIDNDQNGYVDDFRGYDALNGGDSPGSSNNNHGTVVAGIIGARGDNSEGISGLNWNVKLLSITNAGEVSSIIRGHQYVYKLRKAYNTSNGQSGAFVVALNASFGIDEAKAENFPVWCSLYDSLGSVGVLSAAATANKTVDVDIVGDMPTTCTSEFLISVTNINEIDVLANGSGYGSKSIDIGAPGYRLFALTSSAEAYATTSTSGTSWAAPHVSGSIALLYSIPCPALSGDALTNPSFCAQRVRKLIFDHVEPSSSLEGKTTTGGRVNIGASADAVRSLCDGSVGKLEIKEIVPNIGRGVLTISYETPDFESYSVRVFNMLGQLILDTTAYPDQFSAKTLEIDSSNLAHGMYWVVIGRGKVFVSKKFVKI